MRRHFEGSTETWDEAPGTEGDGKAALGYTHDCTARQAQSQGNFDARSQAEIRNPQLVALRAEVQRDRALHRHGAAIHGIRLEVPLLDRVDRGAGKQ